LEEQVPKEVKLNKTDVVALDHAPNMVQLKQHLATKKIYEDRLEAVDAEILKTVELCKADQRQILRDKGETVLDTDPVEIDKRDVLGKTMVKQGKPGKEKEVEIETVVGEEIFLVFGE
jgi:hypothetical protein